MYLWLHNFSHIPLPAFFCLPFPLHSAVHISAPTVANLPSFLPTLPISAGKSPCFGNSLSLRQTDVVSYPASPHPCVFPLSNQLLKSHVCPPYFSSY